MVSQSSWTGTLQCGLVHVPVRAVAALRDGSIRFSQRHRGCGGRVEQPRRCAADGTLLDASQVVRTYILDDEHGVEVEDEELEALAAPPSASLTIERCVPLDEVDPLICGHHHLLLPRAGGESGYAMLAAALAQERRAGLGQVTIRNRDATALILPHGRGLLLSTLRPAEDLVAAGRIAQALRETPEPSGQELALACQLVRVMAGTFESHTIRDPYRERLRALIEEKSAMVLPGPTPHSIVELEQLVALEQGEAVALAG